MTTLPLRKRFAYWLGHRLHDIAFDLVDWSRR